ncbi:MAG: hypothetical protein NUV87_04140 [Candidatus Roizmanbacteria bacterium]|nr:hypothetical protein [Candidatus Roizmanbacteria bacterium]MCR4313541.1 hypothetical protein [Candidatus Roizmanbacteria bacterium]
MGCRGLVCKLLTSLFDQNILKNESFKRIKKNPGSLTGNVESNIIDTNFFKKLAPLAIGVLGVIAGLASFSLGNESVGFFLTSFGSAHLIENIVYYQRQIRLKLKK